MKEAYIREIDKLMQKTTDVDLLDLVYKILMEDCAA